LDATPITIGLNNYIYKNFYKYKKMKINIINSTITLNQSFWKKIMLSSIMFGQEEFLLPSYFNLVDTVWTNVATRLPLMENKQDSRTYIIEKFQPRRLAHRRHLLTMLYLHANFREYVERIHILPPIVGHETEFYVVKDADRTESTLLSRIRLTDLRPHHVQHIIHQLIQAIAAFQSKG
jgi:hypothetical protein